MVFSHYSKWIPKFADRIALLVRAKTFPFPLSLKLVIEESVVTSIDETLPFELECFRHSTNGRIKSKW